MSVFIDASAIVAILSQEPDADDLLSKIESIDGNLYFSAVSLFEATFGLVRKKKRTGRRADAATIEEARSIVRAFLDRINAEEIPIDGAVGDGAIDAASRFGKVVGHPAQLNMGDCFAYACAVDRTAALLFKGDDFIHTDVPRA